MGDMPPELEDFSEVIKTVKSEQNKDIGDYTKTIEQLQSEERAQFEQKLEQVKKEEQLKELKQKSEPGKSVSGLKKGFLSGNSIGKQSEIEEIKVDEKKKQQNKLEIPEVQSAMQMNDYLSKTQKEWMTPEFLNKVSQNPKLLKFFSNPEYQQAMQLMQTNPKKVLEVYGKNAELMDMIQEFCKLMGTQLETVGKQAGTTETTKKTPELKQKPPPVQEIDEKFNQKLEDPAVKGILGDPKVQKFIAYLQTQQKVDFQMISRKDPDLAQKIFILIQKGVINLSQ